MSKIHVMRFPMDDDFYEISISLKSNPLCKLLNRYKDALIEKLEITITDRKFTFKDNQYASYIPYFPDRIVEGLIYLIDFWRDCEYISDSVAEQLIKELADDTLNLSNSVYDMQWQEIHHETVYDEDGNIDEKVTRKESFVNKVCFKYNSEDSHIINYYDAQDLKGDKKTIYELVAKNYYFLPQLGSVLYEKYARTDSFWSVYKGEQYKNAVLKLTKDEFISILDYLVEKDYLRTDEDETQRLSYYPSDKDLHVYIEVKCEENSCDN